MTIRRVLALVPLLFLAALAVVGASSFRINGSATMLQLGEKLTAWYAKKYPAMQFQVAASQETNSFAAMAAGEVEIVQSSRKVLHSESVALREARGKSYVELQVATEIAGIAVNQANPVKELSLFQLRQVLSGSVKNWKQVGGADAPITIYGRDDSSGVRAFLEDEFIGDQSISASAKTFANNSAVLSAVSRDQNGVGFGTVEGNLDPKVGFVAIKPSTNAEGVAPTGDAIRTKHYKLIRPLYFYFAGAPKGDLLQFAQWILSPEGQLVVESVGYYPLTPAEREEGRQALESKSN
jgi:phosphate transport system substrate-binding protein